MTSIFDTDTASVVVDETGDTSVVSGTVTDNWDVIAPGPPNGGYIMSMAVRAMKQRSEHPHLATATAHFLRPAMHGDADITTRVVKVGRRLTTVTALLSQAGTDRLSVTASFADLTQPGPTGTLRSPLDLPPPSACVGIDDERSPFTTPPIARRLGLQLVPDDVGWALGSPSGTGLMRGWAEFEDGRPMDDLGAVVLSDAFPPAVFNAGIPVGWPPTVELTVHVRHPGPITQPIACRFMSTWATNGFIEEDGIMELADGTPVAMSRQLLLAPRA